MSEGCFFMLEAESLGVPVTTKQAAVVHTLGGPSVRQLEYLCLALRIHALTPRCTGKY